MRGGEGVDAGEFLGAGFPGGSLDVGVDLFGPGDAGAHRLEPRRSRPDQLTSGLQQRLTVAPGLSVPIQATTILTQAPLVRSHRDAVGDRVPDHCGQAIFLARAGAEIAPLRVPHQQPPPLQVPGDARDNLAGQRIEFRRCLWRNAPKAWPGRGQLMDAIEHQQNNVAEGKANYGYNAQTGEFGDLVSMGIIDPTKVARSVVVMSPACTDRSPLSYCVRRLI